MQRKFNGPPKRVIVLPLDIEKAWDSEFEWDLPIPAPLKKKTHRGHSTRGKGSLARHRAKRLDAWHRKKAERLAKKIKSEFERARLVALADAQKKILQYRAEIAIAEFEERYEQGRREWFDQCRREADDYLAKLKKAAA
jgi:hypothetical protein